jgi:hypothetical protein
LSKSDAAMKSSGCVINDFCISYVIKFFAIKFELC